MSNRIIVLALLAVVAMIGIAYADVDDVSHANPEVGTLGPSNPANGTIGGVESAIDHAMTTIMANQPVTHAADAAVCPAPTSSATTMSTAAPAATSTTSEAPSSAYDWFTKPVPYVELGWTRNHQTRDGLLGNAYSGNLGIDFVTVDSIAAGAALNYTNYNGRSEGSLTDRENTVGGTIYAAGKVVDPVVAGMAINKGWTWANFPGEADLTEDNWTFSPFVGVPYACGPASAYSALAFVARWEQDKLDGVGSADGNDAQFVWMNSIGYAVDPQLTVKGMVNVNQIVANHPSAGSTEVDHNWVTVGAKASYMLDANKELYAGASMPFFNNDFHSVTVSAGLAMSI